uniref:DEUBAD domain-containing protein n=1 Tax=Leersia perrieri TaxID=77586 RepID=A0A0D9X9D9_9ORYZ
MGIVKVARCVPTEKWACNGSDEGITQEEKMLLQSLPIHESDEHVEVNCELAKSGDQVCSVPYDLYDLPQMNDVLSLETWNLCLTEDDRFRLAAYLPDMDQQDFFLTMKELFNGCDMFFGSPVQSFFNRLNGGLYSLDVSQPRELLLIFERRRHYHFLKSYHDGLISKFASMGKVWRSRGVSTSLQGKVHTWNDTRHEDPLTGVDIDSSPLNRSLSVINEDKSATVAPFKRAKCMDGTVTTQFSAKPKGIDYRAKSMEMSSLSPISHVPSELNTTCIRLPKGVLKIKNDYTSFNNHNEGMHYTAEPMQADQLGVQVSSLPLATALDVHGVALNSAYYYHMSTSKSTLQNLRSNAYQRDSTLDTYPLSVKSLRGVQIMVPEELERGNFSGMLGTCHQSATEHSPPAYCNELSGTTELPHEKNLLKNFGQRNAITPGSSPYSFTRITDCHQTNGCIPHSLKTAESISEVLTLDRDTPASYKHLSEQSETIHRYPEGLKMKTAASQTATEVEEGYKYPYTYKRRKLQKRLDFVDPVQKSTTVSSESPSALASMTNVKGEGNQAMKIGS